MTFFVCENIKFEPVFNDMNRICNCEMNFSKIQQLDKQQHS